MQLSSFIYSLIIVKNLIPQSSLQLYSVCHFFLGSHHYQVMIQSSYSSYQLIFQLFSFCLENAHFSQYFLPLQRSPMNNEMDVERCLCANYVYFPFWIQNLHLWLSHAVFLSFNSFLHHESTLFSFQYQTKQSYIDQALDLKCSDPCQWLLIKSP